MNKIGILQGRLTASNGRGIQFFPTENWRQEFMLAKNIGFDCIEWLIEKEDPNDNPIFLASAMREIQDLQTKTGVSIPSVHGFYRKDEHYPDEAVTLIEKTREVGANLILISFFKDNILATLEDKKLAVEQLRKAVAKAEQLGVRIGIETELAAREVLEFVAMFKSDAVGVYYDIGNMVSMGVDVVSEIRQIGPLIYGVHIKDRKRGGKTIPFGEGDSDFPAIFAVLKEIGYQGAYIFQGARSEGVDDVILNTRYYDYVKNLLTEIETK